MSSVAGAVVTIDGDSSGLVGALSKGEKALGGVKTEARKLSDQLREVTDEADIAAGKLVQSIGGPGAIKAIAGITAGVAGAKVGVDMFLASTEAMFRSYGEAGQAAWDEVEKALFSLQGAFAEAALGGGDMNEMADRLIAVLEFIKIGIEVALVPLRAFVELLKWLASDSDAAAVKQRELTKAERDFAKATDETATSQTQVQKGYDGVKRSVIALLGTKKELALFDLNAQSQSIHAIVQQQEALDFTRLQAAGNLAADRAEAEERAKMGESFTEAFSTIANKRINAARDAARQEAVARLAEEGKGQNEQKNQLIAALRKLDEERQKIIDGRTVIEEGNGTPTNTPTGGGKPPKEAVDAMLKVTELADGTIKILTDAEAAAMQAAAEAAGSNMTTVIEIKKSEYDQLATMKSDHDAAMLAMDTARDQAAEAAQRDHTAKVKAEEELVLQGKLDAINEEMEAIQVAKEKEIADDKAAKATLFNLAVTQNGKMLANAIVGNKKMSEVARAALGNVASGLGDIAMVEAGKYAAAGDYPQAAAMATAGTLGYTIAAALGADKKANAGPPTERAQPVQNYAYNLRIDAAFADSESVSRRFAQMQEGARQRGLITAAA